LTGSIQEQCIFLLIGTGANGKSTLLETACGVLGDYARSTDFGTFLAKDRESVRNDIARVRELSMAWPALPRVKQRIRTLDMVAATRRARMIMDQYDSERIAALLDDFNTLA
jgi:ABC-type multidrug transport system ATPase subunit